MIKEILKNCKEFQQVLADIKGGRQAHSYLFISEDEYTAKEMAKLTAQALLCPDICDMCENCRKFNTEHPDVKYFPTKDKLLVEDSNYIASESYIKPIFANRKIFVINNFDKSTPEAQNKLLKTLEEPNSNMFYLLSTSNLNGVLPTIRSRCFKVQVGGFDQEIIKKELHGNNEIALALGNGYLGKTIELSKKTNLNDVFENAKNIICKLKQSKDVIIYSKKVLDKKDDIEFTFEILSAILEDIIAVKTRKFELMKFTNIKEDLRAVADEYSMKSISEIEKLIIQVKKEIESWTNMSLIVDNFLMNLLEVKYLCR